MMEEFMLDNGSSAPFGLPVAQCVASAFLAILFLQSGLDKVTDFKGNLSWLTGHFSKSPLAKVVPALLITITLLELLAGTLCAIGLLIMLWMGNTTIAGYGTIVSALALVGLFAGQRIAKDYAGASALVPYFMVVLVDLILLYGQ